MIILELVHIALPSYSNVGLTRTQDSVSNETQKESLFYCDAPRSPVKDQTCPNPAGFSQELRTCFGHQDLGADNIVELLSGYTDCDVFYIDIRDQLCNTISLYAVSIIMFCDCNHPKAKERLGYK